MIQPRKLSNAVVNILQARLVDEYTAFAFYRNASNWCKNVGLFVAAKYFEEESNSELGHAKMIENMLVDWNVAPIIPSISTPDKCSSLAEIITDAYELESGLYDSYEKNAADLLTSDEINGFRFLQQFVQIQNDSVAEYSDMINILSGVDYSDKFKLLELEENLFGD